MAHGAVGEALRKRCKAWGDCRCPAYRKKHARSTPAPSCGALPQAAGRFACFGWRDLAMFGRFYRSFWRIVAACLDRVQAQKNRR